MAGQLAGFDPDAFRTGISIAMEMSMPQNPEHRPEFVIITPGDPGDVLVDDNGVPWDVTAVAPEAVVTSVRALCAVETSSSGTEGRARQLQPGVAEITILDTEYAKVKGFEYVNLWLAGQDEAAQYRYVRVLEQPNLGPVGVWTLECRAEDVV